MHNIRSRRFSSVRFWHLVLLIFTVIGLLSTSVVYAQAPLIQTDTNIQTGRPAFALSRTEAAFCEAQSASASADAIVATTSATTKFVSAVPITPPMSLVLLPDYRSTEALVAQLCNWNTQPKSLFTALFTKPVISTESGDNDVRPRQSTRENYMLGLSKELLPTPEPTPVPTRSPTPTEKPSSTLTATPIPKLTPKPTAKPVLTPTPQPAPKVIAAPADLEGLFQQHATTHGVSAEVMKKIAQCESGMRPEAVNGPYGGMFQFNTSTWISNRKAMGKDTNPSLRYHAAEAIETAAFKMGRDGYDAWPACSRKALASI